MTRGGAAKAVLFDPCSVVPTHYSTHPAARRAAGAAQESAEQAQLVEAAAAVAEELRVRRALVELIEEAAASLPRRTHESLTHRHVTRYVALRHELPLHHLPRQTRRRTGR